MDELTQVVERAASDPSATTRELTIAMSDADQIASLPALATAFARSLPRARLRVISIDALISGGGLEAGAADCAMGPVESVGSNHSQHLFDEEGVLFARRGHPALRKKFTPELFASLRHVDIQLALGRGGVGNRSARDAFASSGLQREIAVTVPSFAAAAMVIGSTDLIGGLPRRVAKQLAATAELQALQIPMPPLLFRMHLMWHARTHEDAVAKRFRQVVIRALATR
jgi:DNA-binding transcriptional LysR family regulator